MGSQKLELRPGVWLAPRHLTFSAREEPILAIYTPVTIPRGPVTILTNQKGWSCFNAFTDWMLKPSGCSREQCPNLPGFRDGHKIRQSEAVTHSGVQVTQPRAIQNGVDCKVLQLASTTKHGFQRLLLNWEICRPSIVPGLILGSHPNNSYER